LYPRQCRKPNRDSGERLSYGDNSVRGPRELSRHSFASKQHANTVRTQSAKSQFAHRRASSPTRSGYLIVSADETMNAAGATTPCPNRNGLLSLGRRAPRLSAGSSRRLYKRKLYGLLCSEGISAGSCKAAFTGLIRRQYGQ